MCIEYFIIKIFTIVCICNYITLAVFNIHARNSTGDSIIKNIERIYIEHY